MNINLLKAEMAKRGINQRILAERLKVTPGGISFKLAGKRKISVDEARAICNALEITDLEQMAEIFLA